MSWVSTALPKSSRPGRPPWRGRCEEDSLLKEMAMSWDGDRVELLKKLWQEGISASPIAAQLGAGITRNGVIGKVHRLGLSGRAKPASSSPAPRAKRAAQPMVAQKTMALRGNTVI